MCIEGSPPPITGASLRDAATGVADPVKFINLYCPTSRSLLATYAFIVKQDGSLVDVNGSPEHPNDLLLDLKNGLDRPDRPASADPNVFASAVGHTAVLYARDEETVYQVREINTAAADAVFPLDAWFEQDVAAGTPWCLDIAARLGDGTVPALSAAGQFEGDGRLDAIVRRTGNTSHAALMANPGGQAVILNVLGIAPQEVEISSRLAWMEEPNHIIAAVSDAVGFLMAVGTRAVRDGKPTRPLGAGEPPASAMNPVDQAALLTQAGTQLNIGFGPFVGHDIVFFMHSKAPTTVLVAKDRVLGHNPVACLCTGHS